VDAVLAKDVGHLQVAFAQRRDCHVTAPGGSLQAHLAAEGIGFHDRADDLAVRETDREATEEDQRIGTPRTFRRSG
jgi:hypothetical protein